MKKILFFLLACTSVWTSAQNQRFFYDYKYIPDSANREEIQTDMMLLDVTKDGSRYYSHSMFVADSISQADLAKQIRSGSTNFNIGITTKPGTVHYSVTKSYPDYKVFLFTSISSDKYKVAEEEKPVWKILPDQQKIGSWNTQKAETDFGGRHWTAWFTNEIPIQDGPYTFYGLPGLIVKIEDATASHIMTLEGVKPFETPAEKEKESLPQGVVISNFNSKAIDITMKQFRKLWKAYVNDPAKNMREMLMKAGGNTKVSIRFSGPGGKETTDNQQAIRAIEQNAKEQIRKNNNPIQPDLYQ